MFLEMPMSEPEFYFLCFCLTLVALVALGSDKDTIILKALSLFTPKIDILTIIAKLCKIMLHRHSRKESYYAKRKNKPS